MEEGIVLMGFATSCFFHFKKRLAVPSLVVLASLSSCARNNQSPTTQISDLREARFQQKLQAEVEGRELPPIGLDLIEALYRNDLDKAYQLVSDGVDPNSKDYQHKCTAFYFVAGYTLDRPGALKLVKFMMEKGANIDEPNYRGQTPLMCACEFQNADVAAYLISKGADVNKSDNSGATAAQIAALRDDRDILEMLAKNRADMNQRDNRGDTPLDWAVYRRKTDAEAFLVGIGAKRGSELTTEGAK